jgi:protoheme IX farnesyltransferase
VPTPVATFLDVFKPRIGVVIMLAALGGVAVAPGALPETSRIAAVALAVFVASLSSGAFNQWAERDLDARMRRTARRPFASGRYKAGPGWLALIIVLLVASVALAALVANAWAALYTFLGAFTYGVIYTLWLKRRSWTNIVIGGLAGSFAVLAGAAAVDPTPSPAPILLAVVLFLWTPPHFWSLAMATRDDYVRAGVPMLPVVAGDAVCAKVILAHTVALSVVALVPALYGMGLIYLAAALVGGAWFTQASIGLVRDPSRVQAMRTFGASLAQLALLLSGAMLDRWLLGLGA